MRTKISWTKEELNSFRQNLRKAIGWTILLSEDFDYTNGKFGLVLRKTNPIYKGFPLYKFGIPSNEISRMDSRFNFGDDYSSWKDWDYSFDGYDFLLKEAIKTRTIESDFDLSEIDKLGRILSFQTCVTTHDGGPIVASRNFVDEGDIPPIDTWFFLKRNYFHSGYKCEQSLFCWIPKQFEKVMQQAIDVEILGSYRWFDENDKLNYDLVKNNG